MTNFFYFKACNCDGDGSNGTACDNNGVCSCKVNFMNGKCDVCNAGFFNFPTCEGNQYINPTSIKLELTFILFSKLVIVMEMDRIVLHVMTLVCAVVKPIS